MHECTLLGGEYVVRVNSVVSTFQIVASDECGTAAASSSSAVSLDLSHLVQTTWFGELCRNRSGEPFNVVYRFPALRITSSSSDGPAASRVHSGVVAVLSVNGTLRIHTTGFVDDKWPLARYVWEYLAPRTYGDARLGDGSSRPTRHVLSGQTTRLTLLEHASASSSFFNATVYRPASKSRISLRAVREKVGDGIIVGNRSGIAEGSGLLKSIRPREVGVDSKESPTWDTVFASVLPDAQLYSAADGVPREGSVAEELTDRWASVEQIATKLETRDVRLKVYFREPSASRVDVVVAKSGTLRVLFAQSTEDVEWAVVHAIAPLLAECEE